MVSCSDVRLNELTPMMITVNCCTPLCTRMTTGRMHLDPQKCEEVLTLSDDIKSGRVKEWELRLDNE